MGLDEPSQAGGQRTLRRLTSVLGLALAAGGAPFAAGLVPAAPDPDARVVGGNSPVNAPGPTDAGYTAHNSPALVVNPTDPNNLAVASRVDLPQFGCGLHVSSDGGGSWSPVPVPMPAEQTVGCFAPDAAFGADGTLYVAFSSFAPVPGHGTVQSGVWLVRSEDGGRSFVGPTRAAGPLAFQVRLAADAERPGKLYLTWLQADGSAAWGLPDVGNPLVVSRSDDGGATWNTPVRASATSRARVVAPALALGRDDEVLLTYLDVGEDRLDYAGAHEGKGGPPYGGRWSLVASRSSDGGASWQETTLTDGLTPATRFLQLFPATPAVAMDRARNRAYVAFHDARLGDADVWVWTSADGGTAWDQARRANDTRPEDGTSQLLPWLAVAENGRLDVVYYDRRSDPDDVRTQVSFQSSFDGGQSFDRSVRLADAPFDSRVGFGSERDMPELGNRLGLVATAPGALAVWSDTRAGTDATGVQDLAQALLAVRAPGRQSGAWRIGGVVAAVTGLAVVTTGRWRRQDDPRKVGNGNRWQKTPISSP